MARLLPLACLLAVLCAPGSSAWASPEAEARLVQQTLPQLAGRAAAAEAAATDGSAFFRGEQSLGRAFPDLALAPLFQPGFVADARRGLLAGAQTRATARRAGPPAEISPTLAAQWRTSWARVHDAEERRDAAVERLLAAIAAGLAQAPDLSTPQTNTKEAHWAEVMAAGEKAEAGTPAAAAARSARNAVQRLTHLRAAAIRQMAIPGDQTLATLIQTELSVPVPGAGSALEQAAARQRLDQVRWAAPLLSNAAEVAAQADAMTSAMGPPSKQAAAADAQVAVAQRAADEAQARAEAAHSESNEAQLQSMVADLRARIASDLETEAQRHSDAQARLLALEARVAAHRADLSTAQAPLVSDRAERIHRTLREARQSVAEIRAERASLQQIAQEAASRKAAAEEELALGPDTIDAPATAELMGAIHDYREVHQQVQQNIQAEERQAMDLLHDAKRVRDAAYSGASASVRREIPVADEMAREAAEIPNLLLATGLSYLRAITAFPSKVVAMHTLGDVLVRLAQLAIVLGLWSLVRRKSADWVRAGLMSIDPRQKGSQRPWEAAQAPSWMVAGEISALEAPLTSIARALSDLLLAGVFFVFLSSRVPILALVVFFFVVGALARLLPGLVSTALITPLEVRPALRVTTVGVRDRSRWTVRILVLWWGLDYALVFAGMQVLDAPRMAATAHSAALILLLAVALIGLRRWAPEIRAKIASDGDPGALNTWIGAENTSTTGTTFRAAVGATVIFLGMCVHLLTLIIEGRGGLGWLSAALARRQLNTDDATQRVRLPEAHLSAIRAQALGAQRPPTQIAQIMSIFGDWEGEHRQGMVALTGDRGMGKSRVVKAIPQHLGTDRQVVSIAVPNRLTNPDKALLWLAEAAGLSGLSLPESDDLEVRAEAVGSALRALPETFFIVDDTHRLFLRSVGCFDALRAVLVAMQASSSHHFWLCSFHGPAFSYLDGVQAVSHLAVFRARVLVDPMPPTELRAWLEGATAAAGPHARYDVLLQRPGTGAHLQRMLERTSGAYWRLLAEASQGNPDVALDYWLSELYLPDSEDVDAVDVGLFRAPETQDLEALGDGALFTLTALIIHDGATLDELHASLNLPEGEVRGTCRSLEAMGIIEDEDGDETYEVSNRWLPAVERLLRRKSFLHRR